MAELHTYTCDVCDAKKDRANHWFRAEYWPMAHTFHIACWDNFQPMEATAASVELHLCSESCAAKAMSKAIGAGQ